MSTEKPQYFSAQGALGFWKALDETFPSTRHQRCWLHKTLNVLDKFPKSMQPNAHKDLREIWPLPVILESQNATSVVDGATIEPRTRINRRDGRKHRPIHGYTPDRVYGRDKPN